MKKFNKYFFKKSILLKLFNYRYKIISVILFITLSSQLFTICGCSDDTQINNTTSQNQTTSVTGSVNINEIGGSNLSVQSIFKQNCPVNNGQYTTDVSKLGTQLLFITDGNQQVRGLTLSKLDNGNPTPLTGDAQSTAYSLMFLTPGITTTREDSSITRINRLNTMSQFQNLVVYLRNNLPANSLNSLLQQQYTYSLLLDCIVNFWGIDTVLSNNAVNNRNDYLEPDLYFWVTKLSGWQVELKNFNWRYVKVQRRDIRFDNTEKSHSELQFNMGGGIPYSLGSIFTFTEFQPSKNYDDNFGTVGSDVKYSEYWVTGPGHQLGEQPSSNINNDLLVQTIATGIMYILLPVVDLFSGGSIALPMNDLMTKATEIADIIKTNVEIQNAAYNMLQASSVSEMAADFLDLLQTALELLVEPPSILVTKRIISFEIAENLRILLPFINASLGGANLIICIARLWDSPKYSRYNIYTRIPKLLSPPNNSSNQSLTPTLSWDVVATATNYNVQISENQNFSSFVVNEYIPGPPPSYTVPNGRLNNGTKYYWRVNSNGSEGTSSWSEVWNFRTQTSGGNPTPIAYYPFNGNANDESGNGNHGILKNGVTFVNDRFNNPNKAAHFDGVDEYVDIDAHSNIIPTTSNNFTISAWVKWDQVPGDNQVVIAYGGNIYPIGQGFILGYERANKSDFQVCSGNLWYSAVSSITPSSNRWYHFVGIFDHSYIYFYLDGVLKASKSLGTNMNPATTLRIGHESYTNNVGHYYLKGTIDDVKIFNRALSQNEIEQLYHEGGWSQ